MKPTEQQKFQSVSPSYVFAFDFALIVHSQSHDDCPLKRGSNMPKVDSYSLLLAIENCNLIGDDEKKMNLQLHRSLSISYYLSLSLFHAFIFLTDLVSYRQERLNI